MLKVGVKRLDHAKGLSLPFYATAGSAGADIKAALTQDLTLNPFERALIPTGYAFEIPAGYEMQIRSRSGLSYKQGVIVLNSPATIDADYQGEVKVLLCNLGAAPFTVTRGMRIAQLVIASVLQAQYTEIMAFKETSERQSGGFGSTGL
tara:strand:- start:446 stop:892 length:447 start_codon:yes stop_codon:yes gene_type:complete